MSNVTLPRIGVPLGTRGERVSPEFYRWMHDITERVGGVVSVGIGELEAQAEALGKAAEDSELAAYSMRGQIAAMSSRTVEIPVELINNLLSRLASLERKVRNIEGEIL